MPATASMLIHLGIVGAVLVVPGWAPMRLPALMAELVEPDAPAPPPLAWPLTPPRPIATPMPLEPPAPPRPEPEPARPTAPEPPPATTRPEPEPPRAAATESARMPTPSPEAGSPVAVTGPSISAAPDPGAATFAAPAPAPPSSGGAPPSAAAQTPAVTALPSDGVTQRAIPRGGYQYLPAYPSSARRLGIQGTAILHVLVAERGASPRSSSSSPPDIPISTGLPPTRSVAGGSSRRAAARNQWRCGCSSPSSSGSDEEIVMT
jgi:outer membrane biosynthesis protein TonB